MTSVQLGKPLAASPMGSFRGGWGPRTRRVLQLASSKGRAGRVGATLCQVS